MSLPQFIDVDVNDWWVVGEVFSTLKWDFTHKTRKAARMRPVMEGV